MFSLALRFVLVFFSTVSIAITSPRRELICVLLCSFVCFARDGLCRFPLPLGVRKLLQLVITAFPRFFFSPVCIFN